MTNNLKQTVIKNPTWWKRRSALERGLTVLAVFGVILSIGLAIGLGVLASKCTSCNDNREMVLGAQLELGTEPSLRGILGIFNAPSAEDNICQKEECIHTASRILNNLDPSVEPCDDFYKFACGSFIKTTTIPDDKTSVNTFSVIDDELSKQVRSRIEEPLEPNEPKSFRLVKTLYKTCMDKTEIEKQGLKPLLNILKKLGGWPVLEGDTWNETEFDWKKAVYKFRETGYSCDYFIDFSVVTDLKNSTKRVIDIDQAILGLSREYLIKGMEEKFVDAYYKYMVDIAVILGADKSRAIEELKDSLEFEIKLANISLPTEKRRNATKMYNPTTIRDLQKKHPSIPWKEYINTLLPESVRVDDDEVVIISVPEFLVDVEKLLKETPKRIQANYVLWRAASASVKYLNEEIRARQLRFSTAVSGRTEREPRWKECVGLVAESLSISVGALYVRKYFEKSAKSNAVGMVKDIQDTFIKILKRVDWMDENTKNSAIDKAMSMATHIAYPDELLDNNKIDEFYAKLELDGDNYLLKILNLTQFNTNYAFEKLRKPVNKSEWLRHATPAVVNAFYSPIENSIQFPAGILQGAFFHKDRPRYMNYGAIGYVIGHEITHGFDDQGRQFDKDGNLVDWWSPSSKEKYLKKAQCIIDQYGNYTAEEVNLKLNGINTQGENIADNGGVKEAYIAYNDWVKRNGVEPRLPGLKYNPNQMFWISVANTWCSKYRPETLKNRITTGYHSPGEFRVLGPLSNMPEFAKDFSCPIGSKMNPKKKCNVW